MYKTIIHCDNDDYTLETDGVLTAYALNDIIYIQNEDNQEVFAINKDKLVAIDFNNKIDGEQF